MNIMNETMCRYIGDREQAIVAYLYGELAAEERVQFDVHLASCARCRTEVAAFSDVRGQLERWAPPEPMGWSVDGYAALTTSDQPSATSYQLPATSHQLPATSHQPLATSHQPPAASHQSDLAWWWRVPVWAQVAAALLFFGVGAGLANLDVHHDADGLHIRTGWSRGIEPAHLAADAAAPGKNAAAKNVENAAATRAELTALETRLREELERDRAATAAAASAAGPANGVSAETLRRVRALVDESEKRQQRELALRVGEMFRDLNAQRQSDLARIDRNLGVMQSNTGVEMMRQRETLNNILVRTSLQK